MKKIVPKLYCVKAVCDASDRESRPEIINWTRTSEVYLSIPLNCSRVAELRGPVEHVSCGFKKKGCLI